MSEIATAPAAPAPVAPATPSTFAEAGAMLKDKDTWGDVGAPAPIDPAAVEAAVDAAADATKPEGAQPTADAPAPDPMAGFSVDTEGKLHRPDGTFASAEEITTWNAGAPVPTEQADPAKPDAPIVVTLRGRDGNDVEIEVTDEAAAEVLRTNHREGMRAAEFNKRMTQVQEKEAQYREFEALMETNPESVLLQHLPQEKQINLAVALLAQHWDQLAPHLVKFDTEPASRIAEAANARVRASEQQRTFETRMQTARYASEMETATRALIPDHVDETTAMQFLSDASNDLTSAIRARNGAPVPVQEVKQVLAKRLALYAFDKLAPADTSTPKRALARPVSAPQPTPAKVANPGAQVRRTVTAQRIAAATPPQGAGAATVRAPLVPSNSTIEQASQALRKQQGWGR